MVKRNIPVFVKDELLRSFFDEIIDFNLSKLFKLTLVDEEIVKSKEHKIIIIDQDSVDIIKFQKKKYDLIVLISSQNSSNLNVDECIDVINIPAPFKVYEILNRIENYFHQINTHSKQLMSFKFFTFDPSSRILSNKKDSLRFTEKESQIFMCLLEHSETNIQKKDLLNKVWKYNNEIDTHTLETHIYSLRKKIDKKLRLKNLICFEEKKGYRLNKLLL
ncbi:response regulator transcription factor [Pelagibacterales bacterium SAG-MED32]|nr:response regulator transcription factor [Pelagibacterales bacterium SAG-MED32]|tara:strand:+ start:7958 stop:8614 length:657 start_codon:yes stop_codon:yes gene_type:complete